MNQPTERTRKIYRATWIGMVVNIALSLLKLAAGILGRSGAMIADAVHSISDLATDVIVLIFARISSKPETPATTTDTASTKPSPPSSSA